MNAVPEPTPFQLLLDDLDELQRTKYARPGAAPSRRDTVTKPAPMQKALPADPVKPVDFSRIEKQQDEILKAMRSTQALDTQNAVRDRLVAIGRDYTAGRLTAHQAALYDVLRNRADAMGLQP
jgi:hypothetical protein